MGRKVGCLCILLGAVMLLGAGTLFCRNQLEAARAGHTAGRAAAQLLREIRQQAASSAEPPAEEMPVVEIDGWGYIGCLQIPSLELELPVMDRWDYERLKRSPCRYSGSIPGGDLVLLAHNYRTHFGPIRRLEPGDEVIFVDMGGTAVHYQVAVTTVVKPDDTESVIQSGHALTLMTCTYGGETRIAVCCDMTDAELRSFDP